MKEFAATSFTGFNYKHQSEKYIKTENSAGKKIHFFPNVKQISTMSN